MSFPLTKKSSCVKRDPSDRWKMTSKEKTSKHEISSRFKSKERLLKEDANYFSNPSPPKPLTVPHEFNFNTTSRSQTRIENKSQTKPIDSTNQKVLKKSISQPILTSNPHNNTNSSKNVNNTHTTTKPFNLSTSNSKNNENSQNIKKNITNNSSSASTFKQPNIKPSKTNHTTNNSTNHTDTKPFNLSTTKKRSTTLGDITNQDVVNNYSLKFTVQKSDKPLTLPESPDLATSKRLKNNQL